MIPWVLFDMGYLCYRAMHAVGDLEHEDVPTGIIFGVFSQLRQICLDPRVRSNRIVMFCDSRKSLRKQIYPEYKWRRTERTEEEIERIQMMRGQMDLLVREVFPKIGIPVYQQDGLESDDLIASVALELETLRGSNGGQKRLAVMITSDGDLFQCIGHSVHWYDPQRNTYYDPGLFLEAKGIGCGLWGEVKA